MSYDILAAGAVLWRRGPGGIEVCLVHRPKYDDWTIPKGKLDPGETAEVAARREVREETGHDGELGADLGEIVYEVDKPGQRGTKVVRYWTMEAGAGRFVPDDEVDQLAWLPVEEAEQALSYARDRELLARFRATVGS